jgi:hypothetical protein
MAKLLLLTLLVACNAELILDGGDNGWSQWYRSVDGVMGGRSSISVQRDGNVLEASGEIVTTGGGFAGMYTRLDDVESSPQRRRPARKRRSRSKSSEGSSLRLSRPQSCKNHVL